MHPETVPESNDIETVAPARVGDTLGYAPPLQGKIIVERISI